MLSRYLGSQASLDEFVLGSNGKVVQVWCKVCSLIDDKDKLLVTRSQVPS